MADTAISALASATVPLTGTELVPVVQSGTTDKTTTQDIANVAKQVSAASRILGRGSAGGAGLSQELTIDSTLQLTGTVLSVTPGTYGNAQTANPLSQFAATTSAQLAGVMTDETGTGSLTFANAPTLINPVVGTQTAGDNTTKAASTAFTTSAITTAGAGYGLLANPLSQFASTTSAQFAGVISDETGSGLVVLNNAPTLVNPVVGTQTAGDNSTLAASTAFVTTALASPSIPINAQTGTTYTILATDRSKHVTFSNAATVSVTLPVASTTGFGNGFFFYAENIGVGAVVITPTTSTINALTSIFLDSGSSTLVLSDGTNYRALIIERNGVLVNAQTGTSYTILTGDRGRLITQSNAAASAYTLPVATTIRASWFTYVQNRGAGTLTITPTTSTIDGAASLALTTNQGCLLVSDGTNYFTMRGIGGSGGGVSLSTVNVFTKNQSVSPTVVASATGTYTPDASTSNNFQLTLTGNLTLANPTNLTSGMVLNFTLDEDATGGRTITLGTIYKFPGGTVPTWVTTASAKNFISGYYDGTVIRCGSGVGYA